jgi:hypothetical protein
MELLEVIIFEGYIAEPHNAEVFITAVIEISKDATTILLS